jgi:NAD(P)-dependent dehydrogenase (short-subunit alcohol dehydrogenase family)
MILETGQVAVITGGASGIGFGMAQAFAERGMRLVLADIESASLVQAESDLQQLGIEVASFVTDVTEPADLDRLLAGALDRFGQVDVVCNNAGVNTKLKATWEMDETDWRWVLDVNLFGVIHGIRTFVPYMIERGRGRVVITSSMAGLALVSWIAPYIASKRALVGIAECLNAELSETAPGVGVTVLCPSYVPTRIPDAERNRPPELTPATSAVSAGREPDRNTYRPMSARDVGEILARAVEDDKLYVMTHTEAVDRVREWTSNLMAGIGG